MNNATTSAKTTIHSASGFHTQPQIRRMANAAPTKEMAKRNATSPANQTPTDGALIKSVCSSDKDCKDNRACYKAENDSRDHCNIKNGLLNSPCNAKSGKAEDPCVSPLECFNGKYQRQDQNCLHRGSGCLFRPNSCCDGLECKGSSSNLEVICRIK